MRSFRYQWSEIASALMLLALWAFVAWLAYDALAAGVFKNKGSIYRRDLNPFWYWFHVTTLLVFVASGLAVMAVLACLKPKRSKYDRHPRNDTPLDDGRRRTIDNCDVT